MAIAGIRHTRLSTRSRRSGSWRRLQATAHRDRRLRVFVGQRQLFVRFGSFSVQRASKEPGRVFQSALKEAEYTRLLTVAYGKCCRAWRCLFDGFDIVKPSDKLCLSMLGRSFRIGHAIADSVIVVDFRVT